MHFVVKRKQDTNDRVVVMVEQDSNQDNLEDNKNERLRTTIIEESNKTEYSIDTDKFIGSDIFDAIANGATPGSLAGHGEAEDNSVHTIKIVLIKPKGAGCCANKIPELERTADDGTLNSIALAEVTLEQLQTGSIEIAKRATLTADTSV